MATTFGFLRKLGAEEPGSLPNRFSKFHLRRVWGEPVQSPVTLGAQDML